MSISALPPDSSSRPDAPPGQPRHPAGGARLNWPVWIGLFVVVCGIVLAIFVHQGRAGRAEVLDLLERLETMDRLELTEFWTLRDRSPFGKLRPWRQKVDWTPAPADPRPLPEDFDPEGSTPPPPQLTPPSQARLALAVCPRLEPSNFDAVYLLYDGDDVLCSLALTPVGGYFNRESMNVHEHPDTLIGRMLSDEEQERLELLIDLMELRLAGFDDQSERAGWNRAALEIARQLRAAHGNADQTSPPRA